MWWKRYWVGYRNRLGEIVPDLHIAETCVKKVSENVPGNATIANCRPAHNTVRTIHGTLTATWQQKSNQLSIPHRGDKKTGKDNTYCFTKQGCNTPRGGGGVLYFFLHTLARAQHLPFTPETYQKFQAPQTIFENFATQKYIPILYIYLKKRP